MATHPELAAEQAHIDKAYERLEAMRDAARQRMATVLDQGRGGTPQAKTERDMVVRSSLARLAQLDLGDRPLCFGRIDEAGDEGAAGEGQSYHIGRLPVSGSDSEPLVVDWRAPVAEPFYRATGRDPMGLRLRRHFASEGRRLVGIEDEVFSLDGGPDAPEAADIDVPSGALLAAMSASRSGHLRDIVATVQREQDEIIRAPLSGILVVQGGPGTGKTVVALHRAAYLLYTHRFPLESQGVLVIGPNRLYLRYTEQVLPSLGENGVASSTVEGLLDVDVRGVEPAEVARLKGDAGMSKVLAAAVRARQRSLRHDLVAPYGSVVLRVAAGDLAQVVQAGRRRPGAHNARRRLVEAAVVKRLAADHERARSVVDELRPLPELDAEEAEQADRDDEASALELAADLRRLPEVAEALDRMWPRLSPEELLHDLYGAKPLLALAGKGLLSRGDQEALYRPRSEQLSEVAWTRADIPLLDEASVLLGPTTGRAGTDSEARAYGHIVVDEAQDLSPMQLRMLARRSISGSMTLVGDIAQGTGPHAVSAWDQVTKPLRPRHEPRLVELSVNYRTPAEIMDVAARVLAVSSPDIRPPRSVRSTGALPVVTTAEAGRLIDAVVAAVEGELAALARAPARAPAGRDAKGPLGGTLALICPSSMIADAGRALRAAGLVVSAGSVSGAAPSGAAPSGAAPSGAAREGSPGSVALSVVPVELVKGLEFDAVVVAEPAMIVKEAGLRALYVALTRPTRRLTIVHENLLPDALG
ncbi:MAG: HelD family protein [Acidimicrobiales bacterium]